jgi:hypothetical protein
MYEITGFVVEFMVSASTRILRHDKSILREDYKDYMTCTHVTLCARFSKTVTEETRDRFCGCARKG